MTGVEESIHSRCSRFHDVNYMQFGDEDEGSERKWIIGNFTVFGSEATEIAFAAAHFSLRDFTGKSYQSRQPAINRHRLLPDVYDALSSKLTQMQMVITVRVMERAAHLIWLSFRWSWDAEVDFILAIDRDTFLSSQSKLKALNRRQIMQRRVEKKEEKW